MTDRELLQQALDALENGKKVRAGEGGTKYQPDLEDAVIAALEAALAQPEQEPVAWMRMPKEGDRVVCIEDESLGTVKYLTGGGSPDITFDDGSHGVYLLREFAELFRYADTAPPKREWVGLTDDELWDNFYRVVESKLKKKNMS
jgi:hypothetical protein